MYILSKRSTTALVVGSTALIMLFMSGTAFAASITPMIGGNESSESGNRPIGTVGMVRPAVIGTVSAINSNTLTVTAKNWMRSRSTTAAPTTVTTYTVDATNATVTKNGATTTLSAILIGDTVQVQGTVNGSTVTATAIRDGVGQGMMKGGIERQKSLLPQTSPIQGDGQPVVGGSVTAISGATLTIMNKSNVTYTINAASTTIVKMGTPSATFSSIAVGDTVIVQGSINGTSITASSIIDRGSAASNTSGNQANETPKPRGGIMNAIGGFFSHLFGF